MKFTRHKILPEIILIEPSVFADERGYFFESFQANRYRDAGIKEIFVQDNMSHSKQNTLRGLHYQAKFPQGKLVGVTAGMVFDVIVDIRKSSPTFRRWIGIELTAEPNRCQQIYIPPGFAHGFYVLSDSADFYYKCTDYYVAGDDCGIIWNDPSIGIKWPLLSDREPPLLSAKDQRYPGI